MKEPLKIGVAIEIDRDTEVTEIAPALLDAIFEASADLAGQQKSFRLIITTPDEQIITRDYTAQDCIACNGTGLAPVPGDEQDCAACNGSGLIYGNFE